MTQVAAPSQPPTTSARTIGEILLARSLVTEEQLDEALGFQRDTGKPLGQILVEAGTITRLELASALAEQWGDAETISPTFPGGSAYVGPNDADASPSAQLEELKRTRRALEERMLAFERNAEDEQWQQEIAAGVKALFARVDALEAGLGQVSDRDDSAYLGELREALVQLAQRVEAVAPELDAVRDRVEGAASVAALQYGLSEIAERADDVARHVERVEARGDAVAERLEEVTAGLTSALDELRRTLQLSSAVEDELAARIDRTASQETVDGLRALIESVRAEVAEVAARPLPEPFPASRFEELVTRVDELAERIELGAGVTATEGEPDPRVDALIQRVAELAAGSAGEEALNARLDALQATVSGLSADLAGRHGADAALDARVAEVAARVDRVAAEVTGLPVGDPELAARLEETTRRLDALNTALAGRAETAHLDELTRLVAELSQRPAGDPELASRVEQLAGTVEELAARPTPAEPSPDARVDALLARVEELAGQVAEAAQAQPVAMPNDFDERLGAVDFLEQSLASEIAKAAEEWAAERRELEARLEWLAARVEAVVTAAPDPEAAPVPRATGGSAERSPDVDADVERLRMAVERLMLDFAEHRRALSAAVPGRELDARVRQLAEKVDDLASGIVYAPGDGNGAAPSGSVDRELASQVRSLVSRLEEVEASAAAGRETVLARLERMMGTIDWRLQRLESPGD